MKTPTNAEVRSTAREMFEDEGRIEFDDTPKVSRGTDKGAYVAAWVWVSDEDVAA